MKSKITKINSLVFFAIMITFGLRAQTPAERLLNLKENELLTNANLELLLQDTGNTQSKIFAWLMENREKVDSVLGQDKAEYAIRFTIGKEFIPKSDTWKNSKPGWDYLQDKLNKQFGVLGLEVVYGRRMLYYLHTEDWPAFGKYYQLYFQKALKRPEYDVNSVTWPLFQNVTDMSILKFACDTVMAYAVEKWYQNDAASLDTYANLLYRTGRKEKAIEWQEKAVKMVEGTSHEKELADNLEKMRRNEPTWITGEAGTKKNY